MEKKKAQNNNNTTHTNNIPSSLPSRYPAPIERAIYQISFMKLSNPKRPLIHQVLVSNMVYHYTSMILDQIAIHSSRKQSLALNSMIYQKQFELYIPPRSTSNVVGH